jgi:hypothetical protein
VDEVASVVNKPLLRKLIVLMNGISHDHA